MPTTDKPCYVVLSVRELERLARVAREQKRKRSRAFGCKENPNDAIVINGLVGADSDGVLQIRSWSLAPLEIY